jgi:polyhydroxyalkanoate synthase subunit PhaC
VIEYAAMPIQTPWSDTLGALNRVQFRAIDILRGLQGDAAAAAFGLGPNECSYRVIASGSHWRLRDYVGNNNASPSLLIVAAPIKRPYIWDLAPSVSAIRVFLQECLPVYLLEWMPASPSSNNNGLDEYCRAISACVAEIAGEARHSKPFLIGHSLGGTLAAIYAAYASPTIRGLVLVAAPLCFEAEQSRFRDALVSLVPPIQPDDGPFPGSLLSHLSALASPSTFIWSRLIDATMTLTDPHAVELHARIERWALDEVPLPGKLVHQIIDWLYRENHFCRGVLKLGNVLVGPDNVAVPTLALVNTADDIAPMASIKAFTEALPAENVRIIEYPGEAGVGLQHIAILVGTQARAKLLPQVISWLNSWA